ncbi:dynactin subunit 1-like isoform X2 [Varroa jacobsoni]|uniref:dynactin subunit 1-like isoform X2 n=1 Tax=Varroa jacobsoni TaxID=62625 RepID=UPI000BF91E87|nr:dynactin subunit 1-like isoform X2 [Varroa jacobsoni]
MPERASRTMLLRQGPVRPSKVLLESGSLAGEEDGTKNGEVSEKGKKGLSERSPTFVRRPRSDLAPGVRVVVKGAKMGTIRYVGEIRFAIGIWCGVELDEPVGRHNGEKYGVRYFYCRNNHGIYVPAYKVFPLGRLIEEVSPCSMSLDEPWSLDTDCTSLVSRKSGSFEEFLQETRLSESDIWRMLANQQQQLTPENYNPDSSFAGMALNKIPLRGAAGVNPRSKIGSPPSSRVPETLLNNSRLHQITSTRSSNLQNPSKSNSTILSAGQVSTSRTRGVERKVLGPSNPSLDAKKVVIAMDHAKKSEKPVTKLQQPRNKPMASRASLLRESFTRIKESLPKRQLALWTRRQGTNTDRGLHRASYKHTTSFVFFFTVKSVLLLYAL